MRKISINSRRSLWLSERFDDPRSTQLLSRVSSDESPLQPRRRGSNVPISLKVDALTNQLRMIITGKPGPTDSHVASTLAKSHGPTQNRALLIDATGLEQFPSTAELHDCILPIAREIAAVGISPMALLAHTDAQYGVGRMFQAIGEQNGLMISVFRHEADAVGWLENQRRS